MGSTNYKVTYKCDCGQDYGSCDRRSYFIFNYNRSCDVGTLFHHHHADEPNSKMEYLGAYNDAGLAALIKVLTEEHCERLTEQDLENLKECRGW